MAKKPTEKMKKIKTTQSELSETNNSFIKISLATLFIILGILILLGIFGSGGVIGGFLYRKFALGLFGYIGIVIPFICIYSAITLLFPKRFLPNVLDTTIGIIIIILITGILHVISPHLALGGAIGQTIGSIVINLFSGVGGFLILSLIIFVASLFLFRNSFNIVEWISEMFTQSIDTDNKYDEFFDENEFMEEVVEDENTVVTKTIESPTQENAFEASLQNAEKVSHKVKDIPSDEVSDISINPVYLSEDYTLPPLSILSRSAGKPSVGDIRARGNVIKQTLANFGIDVEMDEVSVGPTVTRYAMKPAQGVKLARITALKQDLSLSLAAHPLRIEAPIPGKSLVGIEIPNITKSSIGLGSLLEDKEFQSSPHRLLVALGKGVTGKSYFANIAKMPHLLIAGTTGSGKSVTVHNLIMSLLYRNTPDELRLIMVDPKRVELTLYDGIPHLLSPVIKEPKKAVLALKWAAKEMERRYDLLEQYQCRDIKSYHENVMIPAHAEFDGTDPESLPKMPYIVCIIDELADIMQAYPRELESAIVRLAQMSRATGIHLILSTQRPSVNVITGLIKANIPSRLALQVASQIDSRTILDTPGAESLLGAGDMLYQGGDMSKPERIQASWLPEEEIKKVVQFIKKKNPSLADHITMSETLDDEKSIIGVNFDDESESDDPLYEEARRFVIEAGKASTSYLQRKLKVGYSRAARLIDLLEENGVVGPAEGSKPREILTSRSSTHVPDNSNSEFLEEDND